MTQSTSNSSMNRPVIYAILALYFIVTVGGAIMSNVPALGVIGGSYSLLGVYLMYFQQRESLKYFFYLGIVLLVFLNAFLISVLILVSMGQLYLSALKGSSVIEQNPLIAIGIAMLLFDLVSIYFLYITRVEFKKEKGKTGVRDTIANAIQNEI